MLLINDQEQVEQNPELEGRFINELIEKLNVVDIVERDLGSQQEPVKVLEYDINVDRIVATGRGDGNGKSDVRDRILVTYGDNENDGRILFLTQSRWTDCPIKDSEDGLYSLVHPGPNMMFVREYFKDYLTSKNVNDYLGGSRTRIVAWTVQEVIKPVYYAFQTPIEAKGSVWGGDEIRPPLLAVGRVNFKLKIHAFCETPDYSSGPQDPVFLEEARVR